MMTSPNLSYADKLTLEEIREIADNLWPERVVPAATPHGAFAESGLRYAFAAGHVARRDVLDVASGTGIGSSFLLSAGAKSVTGVDVSEECVTLARKLYPSCKFMNADGCALPFPDAYFDVVVSFETIEHVSDCSKFIGSCHRVLKSPGTLILSTPNRSVSRFTPNRFHIKEFYREELDRLVGSRFNQFEVFAQNPVNLLSFVPIRTCIRLLEKAKLKELLKRLLRPHHSELTQDWSFEPSKLDPSHRVYPYEEGRVRKPTYIVIVAKK
jgi:ubiquinone/menaquinone biosynthesis C-methylase UbiE